MSSLASTSPRLVDVYDLTAGIGALSLNSDQLGTSSAAASSSQRMSVYAVTDADSAAASAAGAPDDAYATGSASAAAAATTRSKADARPATLVDNFLTDQDISRKNTRDDESHNKDAARESVEKYRRRKRSQAEELYTTYWDAKKKAFRGTLFTHWAYEIVELLGPLFEGSSYLLNPDVDAFFAASKEFWAKRISFLNSKPREIEKIICLTRSCDAMSTKVRNLLRCDGKSITRLEIQGMPLPVLTFFLKNIAVAALLHVLVVMSSAEHLRKLRH